jgi:GH25 family lysozyme M1 (1,4-beta-N-acetylmuramidase)
MVNKPCCIDIYHDDPISDSPTPLAGLDRVKGAGIFACIHKATESVSIKDRTYDARRKKWMKGAIQVTDIDGSTFAADPCWGAYHFLHGEDPAAEARNFLMTARLVPGDMAFCDWEAVGASGHQPSLAAADAFCRAVEDTTGAPCGVYGGNVPRERFASERASDEVLERFRDRPLWLCAYGSYTPERLKTLTPLPWKEAGIWLWQDDGDKYGPGPHSIPGIRGYCDNSTTVGSVTFRRLYNSWRGLGSTDPVA